MKKKKEKPEITRLKNLVAHDRLNFGGDFESLFINDFKKLIFDYFELNDDISLNIIKDGDKFKVQLDFTANNVKSFSYIPK